MSAKFSRFLTGTLIFLNAGLAAAQATAPAPTPAPATPPADAKPAETKITEGPKPPAVTVTPIGFMVGHFVYNSGTVNTADAPITAARGSGRGYDGLLTDGSSTVTARQSRIGAKGRAEFENTAAEALLEVDFFGMHFRGGPGAINQSTLRLRRAFMTFGTKQLQILAGQEWDLLNGMLPISPAHLVIPAFTSAGLWWNRLAQITVMYKHDSGFGAKIGILRPHSNDYAAASAAVSDAIAQTDIPDQGGLSKLPFVQARLSFDHKLFAIGAAAHFGKEKHRGLTTDTGAPKMTSGSKPEFDNAESVTTFAATADAKLMVAGITLFIHGFMGQNMNSFFSLGGVRRVPYENASGNPIAGTVKSIEGIKSRGGRAQIAYDIIPKQLVVSVGGGVEKLDSKDIPQLRGAAVQNTAVIGNITYAPQKNVEFGLEYGRNNTFYKGDFAGAEDSAARAKRGVNNSIAFAAKVGF